MRLVVVGGVAAGMSAAARARRLDKHLEILVLEKGDTVSYGACGLPYYVEGRVRSPEELIVYTPDYFRRERNIEVRTGAQVVAIEHPRRQLVLAGGERIGYDRLVLATGARLDRSGVPGADLPHVFTLQTLADACRLRRFIEDKRPRNAAVIGGGYIGLEVVEALRTHGLAVTLFERSQHFLGRDCPNLTDLVRAHLHRFQVEIRMGTPVTAIDAEQVGGVACELVVWTAGMKPNVQLAADAGVALGRTGAIAATEHLETNLAGVYAAGDCAETRHVVTGRPVYLPLGTTANKMGRVAGANAAGARERFPGIAGTSVVRVCGLGIATTGLSLCQARHEGFDPVSVRIEARERARYFQGSPVTVTLVADRSTRRLLGGGVIGERGVAGRINVLATALAVRMKVDDFEQLDLAYAPPYAAVWDPLLIAAQQLIKEF